MPNLIFFFILFFSQTFAATIEEMAGEMLIVHFRGEVANEDSKRLIQEAHVGGFIFYNWANGLHSPDQVRNLTTSLQKQSDRPLFFAVDQEGGRVLRLKEGFTQPPANAELKTPDEAYYWAKKVGGELSAVGINMNLAPVVDVNSNPNNPVIGNRSYSSNPHVVTEMAAAALKGYKETGILPVIKHFPGHGDTSVDSHVALPVINKDLAALEQVELYPFQHLNTPAIMTAHLLLPQIDSRPVTISPVIIHNLLKNYTGLIITDSLAMQGIRSAPPEEIAILAIEAGHDILLLGGMQLEKSDSEFSIDDVIKIHKAICQATRDGRISEERLKRSWDKMTTRKP
jgi:beta-N-acetylhexosaminidase